MKKNSWKKYTEENLNELNRICDDYKRYITVSKTEREATKEIIKRAKAKGYKDLEE